MEKTIVLENGNIVHSYRIIGTDFIIFRAYEPSSYTGNHGTIQRFNGKVYGDIATRRIGDRMTNSREARKMILDAMPELKQIESMKECINYGLIEVTLQEG